MIQLLVANLTSVMLLAHAVLGCCSHHAHERATAAGMQSVSAPACCAGHQLDEPSEPASEDHQQRCDDAECHFKSADPGKSWQSLALDAPCFVAIDLALELRGQSTIAGWLHASSDRPPGAVRLHLLHQILLV